MTYRTRVKWIKVERSICTWFRCSFFDTSCSLQEVGGGWRSGNEGESTIRLEKGEIQSVFILSSGAQWDETYIDCYPHRNGDILLDVLRSVVEFFAEVSNINSSLQIAREKHEITSSCRQPLVLIALHATTVPVPVLVPEVGREKPSLLGRTSAECPPLWLPFLPCSD